jgi:hypothetical protein
MDLSNYLSENQIFQNLKDFQTEQEQNISNTKNEYLQSASELAYPIIEGVSKITEVAGKVGDIISKGSSMLNEGKNIVENFTNGSQELQTFNKIVKPSVIETPENIGGFNNIQSMFRGNQPTVDPYDVSAITETETGVTSDLENIGETISSTVSKGIDSVASDIGKTAASAVEDVAELGLGDVLGVAGGLFTLGIGIYDTVKAFEPSKAVQDFVSSNPMLEPML